MGLRESRILNEVHPWLSVRLRWLGEVSRLLGGRQLLLSGVRSRSEQLKLYNARSRRPVAFPGCSQHQYGFAADVSYLPFAGITSKGRPRVTSEAETLEIMENFARQVNLTLVSGDPGHRQIYPASVFKPWAVRLGLCDPNPPPRPLSRIESLCGLGAVTARVDGFGQVTCEFSS